MALLWGYFPSQFLNKKPDQICFSSLITPSFSVRFVAVRATGTEGGSRVSGQGAYQDPALLRRPLVSPPVPVVGGEIEEAQEGRPPAGGDGEGEGEGEGKNKKSKRSKAGEWVDWEDQILEDTVPLVGIVRMILHSGKYDSGDRLVPEHEKTILERLLPYHPEFEKKIGSGIDYITGEAGNYRTSVLLYLCVHVREMGRKESRCI